TPLHLVEVEAATDQLDRHRLREPALLALATINHTHAAATDAFAETERTQTRTQKRIDQIVDVAIAGLAADRGRSLVFDRLRIAQQFSGLASQRGIGRTLSVEVPVAQGRLDL